jgi:hypothetical protein
MPEAEYQISVTATKVFNTLGEAMEFFKEKGYGK